MSDKFLEILQCKRNSKRQYNLESIVIDGKTFVNVPAVRDSKTGNSLGFSSKVIDELYRLLDQQLADDVIDFSKYCCI